MSTEQTGDSPDPLTSLAAVMVRPRATLRRVLDSPPDELAVPLILIATFSQLIVEEDYAKVVTAMSSVSIPVAGIILAVSLALGAVITAGLFYAFSYVVSWIGRRLGGKGNAEQVRSALAWGSVPLIWALVFRVPVRAIWGAPVITIVHSGEGTPAFAEAYSALAESGLLVPVLIFALLEATAAIWYLIVLSKCLGEAHEFSAWRGLGNLLLAILVPLFVVLIAIFGTIFIFSSLNG